MVVFTVCFGLYSYLARTGLLGDLSSSSSSWRHHSASPHQKPLLQEGNGSPKPTYTFIVAFGVPKVPPPDFDSESMAHRLTIFATCLDFIMGANNASAELVIVQWAPTVNDTLTKLINWEQLALRSLEMVRIIQVPQEQTHLAPPCISSLHPYRLADPEGPVCLEFVAKNVGARRALGQFLVLFNIDDLLTPQLGSLFSDPHFWGTNIFWRAMRNNLPETLPLHLHGEELYNRALGMLGWGPGGDLQNSIRGPLFAESLWQINAMSDYFSGDFLLIGSKDYFRIGGYPELGKSLVHIYANTVCSFLTISASL